MKRLKRLKDRRKMKFAELENTVGHCIKYFTDTDFSMPGRQDS